MKWLWLEVLVAFLLANFCFGVELVEYSDRLVLRNKYVSLQFGKENGLARGQVDAIHMSRLEHATVNILKNGQLYWDLDARGGWKPKGHCSPSSAPVGHRVLQNRSDLIEIGFINKDSSCGFMMEFYYALREDTQGFHAYAVLRRNLSITQDVQLLQHRMVMRLDPSLFTMSAVPNDSGDERWRTAYFPPPSKCTSAYAVGPKEILHVGVGDRAQDYYTKYSWTVKAARDDVHGAMGESNGRWVGAFVVSASNEYLNGGPNHPEIAVHQTDTTPCLLKMLSGCHYDYLQQSAPKIGWEKLYGPFFVRLDVQNAMNDLLAAADAAMPAERAQWPYQWMTHKLFKHSSSRGMVSGRVKITAPPEGGLRGFAILGAPKSATNATITNQGLDFIYWGDVRSDGSFQIPNVRFGSYSLWLHLPGCLPTEQFMRDQVIVEHDLVVGDVAATNERQAAKILWEIGKADDSVAEFRNGTAAENHGLMLWCDDEASYGNNVNFSVGQDDASVAWHFMQPWFGSRPSVWTINFDKPPAGRLVLTVGVQSANHVGSPHGLQLQVILNDRLLSNATLTEFDTHVFIRTGTTSGTAVPRRLLAELSQKRAAELPAKNVLKLQINGTVTGSGCGNGAVCPNAAVLYDFIRLEHDPIVSLDGEAAEDVDQLHAVV